MIPLFTPQASTTGVDFLWSFLSPGTPAILQTQGACADPLWAFVNTGLVIHPGPVLGGGVDLLWAFIGGGEPVPVTPGTGHGPARVVFAQLSQAGAVLAQLYQDGAVMGQLHQPGATKAEGHYG